ncbi:MAG: DUF3617 domain-containing protein [Burkholderiales bacterium]|nr:DUF3617 domain-containing protein [Burkholderiales bacterium]
MKRLVACLPALVLPCALVVVAPVAVAQQGGPDDLYEITMSMESDGMKLPPMTQTACTPKGAKDEERMPMDKGCRMLESRRSGARTLVKAVCEDGADRMTMTMEIESTGKDAFRVKSTAEGTRDGRAFAMKSDVAGRRVGACKAADASKAMEQAQAQATAAIGKECDKGIESLEAALFVKVEGLDIPPEAMACRDRKAEFCGRVATVSAGIVSPDTWYAVRDRHGARWAQAAKACGTDPVRLVAPLCTSEVSKKNWRFVADACPADAKALVAQRCAGRTYSTVARGDLDMCAALAGLAYTATPRRADAVPAAAPAPGEPEKPKGTVDKLKEGADKLKKFLKF